MKKAIILSIAMAILAAQAWGYEREDLNKLRVKKASVDCDLRKANLDWADLRGANLSGADLLRTSLTDANLVGNNLRGARLNGDLRETYWRGANLSKVN